MQQVMEKTGSVSTDTEPAFKPKKKGLKLTLKLSAKEAETKVKQQFKSFLEVKIRGGKVLFRGQEVPVTDHASVAEIYYQLQQERLLAKADTRVLKRRIRKVPRKTVVHRQITLAEAIRKGKSMKIKQIFGDFQGEEGHACVWGAVSYAINRGTSETTTASHFYNPFGRSANEEGDSLVCPIKGCGNDESSLVGLLIHLNDKHHWGFERIAKWVDKKFPAIKTKESFDLEVEEKA